MHDVALLTPVVCQITFGILDDSDAQARKLDGLPPGSACFTSVLGLFYRLPVYGLKWNVVNGYHNDLKVWSNEDNQRKTF